MKRSFVLKLVIIMISLIGLSCLLSSQSTSSNQYVEVTLNNGETVRYEYQSFVEGNLPLQREMSTTSSENKESFGGRLVTFRLKDTCLEHNTIIDNIQALEVLGVVINTCEGVQKKEWLFKIYQLDLEKYEGYFIQGNFNADRSLSEQGVSGLLLNTSIEKLLRYEDIKSIYFKAW